METVGSASNATARRVGGGWWLLPAFFAILAASSFLLFKNLGTYRLWDDEAEEAILAEQVWRTGDTSALVGTNIIAYNQGAQLHNLHDRANSPLPFYFLAPFIGGECTDALHPRLPFAVCGLAFIGLFLGLLWRARVDGTTWLLFSMAILGNVALFLLFRQARYFAMTLLFSLAVGYLYLRWNGSRRALLAISLLLICIFATHIITYAGVVSALFVDYLAWHRRERPLKWSDWAVLLLPQIVVGAAVLSVWNPFRTNMGQALFANSLGERAILFCWNLRDFNANELGCSLLIVAAPILFLAGFRRSCFWRGPLAIVVYCAVIAAISPKVLRLGWPFADVRYLAPLIPLSMALGVLTLRAAVGNRRWLALPLGLIAFGTNLFNLGPLLKDPSHEGNHDGFHATPVLFVRELLSPVPGPYADTVEWMTANMPPGASVWVLPGWANYPLMYHAPQFVYAWQLANPPALQFIGLDAIHFFGAIPPDYMIAFGPYIRDVEEVIARERGEGVDYAEVAVVNRYWANIHRPAVIHHAFAAPEKFDRDNETIRIFRRLEKKPEPPAQSQIFFP